MKKDRWKASVDSTLIQIIRQNYIFVRLICFVFTSWITFHISDIKQQFTFRITFHISDIKQQFTFRITFHISDIKQQFTFRITFRTFRIDIITFTSLSHFGYKTERTYSTNQWRSVPSALSAVQILSEPGPINFGSKNGNFLQTLLSFSHKIANFSLKCH